MKNNQYRISKVKILKYLQELEGAVEPDNISSTLSLSKVITRQVLNQLYKSGYIIQKNNKYYFKLPERKYTFKLDYTQSEDRNYLLVKIGVMLNGQDYENINYKLSLAKLYKREHQIFRSLSLLKLINYIERNDLKSYLSEGLQIFTEKPFNDLDDYFKEKIDPYWLEKIKFNLQQV